MRLFTAITVRSHRFIEKRCDVYPRPRLPHGRKIRNERESEPRAATLLRDVPLIKTLRFASIRFHSIRFGYKRLEIKVLGAEGGYQEKVQGRGRALALEGS